MYDGRWHDGMWGGMVFGPLIWLILIALVVWVVFSMIRSGDGTNRTENSRGPQARDILDQRYAKGEIDREEYEERRKALSS